MKNVIIFFAMLILASCQSDKKLQPLEIEQTIAPTPDSIATSSEADHVHANQIFQNVTVESLGNHTYKVQGRARIFEATINWSVEDGHYILAEGYTTASIGAPDWGDFEFEVTVKKADVNSSLVLILFESSAKDGSHLHELPIRLL